MEPGVYDADTLFDNFLTGDDVAGYKFGNLASQLKSDGTTPFGLFEKATFEIVKDPADGNQYLKITGTSQAAFGVNYPMEYNCGFMEFAYKFDTDDTAVTKDVLSLAYHYDNSGSTGNSDSSRSENTIAKCAQLQELQYNKINEGQYSSMTAADDNLKIHPTTSWRTCVVASNTQKAFNVGLGFNQAAANKTITLYLDDIIVWAFTDRYANISNSWGTATITFDDADGQILQTSPASPWQRSIFNNISGKGPSGHLTTPHAVVIGSANIHPNLYMVGRKSDNTGGGWSLTPGGGDLKRKADGSHWNFYIPGNITLYPVLAERYTMTDLNQIRFNAPAGLRFVSLIDMPAITNATEYGFVVTREKLLTDANLTANGLELGTDVNKISATALEKVKNETTGEFEATKDVVFESKTNTALGVVEGENKAISAVIVGIDGTTVPYDERFVVRPYMKANGKTYYSNAATKSYYEVAKAYADGGYVGLDDTQKAAVDKIVKTVEDAQK